MRIENQGRPERKGPQWRLSVARAVLAICASLVGEIATSPIAAQVQLPTVNLGFTRFEDGFAAPGFVLEEFPDVYTAGTLKDRRGTTVPGANTLTSIN